MADKSPGRAPVGRSSREDLVESAVAVYENLVHRVACAHASEFVGVAVTMSQAKVLYLVQAEPDMRMSDLARRLAVSLPSMSGVVDRLVDQGMLSRRDDPADRRQALIRVTAAGVGQLELVRELNVRQVRALLAHLEPAELAVVERALGILVEAATAAAPAGTATPSSVAAGRGGPS